LPPASFKNTRDAVFAGANIIRLCGLNQVKFWKISHPFFQWIFHG